MAQAQQPGGPAQRPQDTEEIAVRTLRQLGQQPTVGPTGDQQVRQAFIQANQTVVDARAAAGRVIETLRLPQPAAETRQSQDIVERLQELRTRLRSIRAASTGIETIDRNHQAFLDPMIQAVETTLRGILGEGGREPRRLRPEEIESIAHTVEQIEQRTGWLREVTGGQRALIESSAPPELIAGMDMALVFSSLGQHERARLISTDLPREYQQRADVFASEEGRGQVTGLVGWLRTVAANPRTAMTADQIAESRAALGRIMRGADTIKQMRLEAARQAFSYQMSWLSQQITLEANSRIRDELRRVQDATQAMIERLQRGDQVGEDELRAIARRNTAARDFVTDLASIETPAVRNQVGDIYSATLHVMGEGASQQTMDTLLVAAEMVKRAPSGGYGTVPQGRARTDLATLSTILGSATDAAHRDQALRALTTRMAEIASSSMSVALTRTVPAESRDAFTSVMTPLRTSPETATLAQVRSGLQAVEIANGMSTALRPSVPAPQRTTAIQMFNRAFTALTQEGGTEVAVAHAQLASRYLQAATDARRDELSGLSATLAEHPDQLRLVQNYLERDSQVEALRTERDRLARRGLLPANSPAAQAMDSLIVELETARTRLARGEAVPREMVTPYVAAINERMRTEPDFAARLHQFAQQSNMTDDQAIMQYATEQAQRDEGDRVQELLRAAQSMMRSFGGSMSAGQRRDVGQLFQYAVSALSSPLRRTAAAITFRQSAETYLQLQTDTDRSLLMEICTRANGRSATADQPMFSATDGAQLTVIRQRAEIEARITDPALRLQARAYFDLALIAARGDDPLTAQTVLGMAVLFGGWAAVPDRQLDAQSRQRRTDAFALIRSQLGDYTRIGQRRIINLGTEGAARTAPRPESITAPVARALISQGSVADALAGAQVADEAPAVRVERGLAALNVLADQVDTMTLDLRDVEFSNRLAVVEGRDARSRAALDRTLDSESRRLRGLAAAATRDGDSNLAQYFTDLAGLSSRDYLTTGVSAARDIHARARRESELARGLTGEADRAPGASVDVMTTRLRELRGQLSAQDQQILDRALTEAGSDEARIRVIYVSTLRGLAEVHGSAADSYNTYADGLVSGLDSLGRSHRLTTRRREAGRLQLGVSIGTYRGLGLDQNVDMLGRPIEVETPAADGQGPPTRSPAPLPPARREMLLTQARVTGEIGVSLFRQQEQIQQARDARIAQAATNIRDRNITEVAGLITQLISLFPNEDQRGRYQARLGTAQGLNDAQGRPDYAARSAALQALYQELVRESGTRRPQTEGFMAHPEDAYDANARYGDYRRAVGMYWGENFSGGDHVSSQAQFRITATSWAAGRFISERRAQMALEEARGRGFPPGLSRYMEDLAFFRGMGFEHMGEEGWENITATPALLEELISYAPESERPALRERLRGMSGPTREQLIDEVVNGAPPELRDSMREALRTDQGLDVVERMLGGALVPQGGAARRAFDRLRGAQTAGLQDHDRYTFFLELARRSRGDQLFGPTLLSLVTSGRPAFVDADADWRQAQHSIRRAEGGDMAGAAVELQGLQLQGVRADAAQRMDTERIRRRVAMAPVQADRSRLGRDFYEDYQGPMGEEEGPRDRAHRDDRNAVKAQAAGHLGASMDRDLAELQQSAESFERARDDILRGTATSNPNAPLGVSGVLSLDHNAVLAVYFELSDSDRRRVARESAALHDATDPAEINQRAMELYRAMAGLSHFTDAIDAVTRRVPEEGDVDYRGMRSQFLAEGTGMVASEHHYQRQHAWTFARAMIERGGEDLRRGQEAARSRAHTTGQQMEDTERALGWSPHYYISGDHFDQARMALNMATVILSEDNDVRGYDVLVRNQPISGPAFLFRGTRPREYNHDQPFYIGPSSGYNETVTFQLADQLDLYNQRRMLTMSHYIEDDDVRASTRSLYLGMAERRTTLDLAMFGVHRESHGDGTWGLSRWQPANMEEARVLNDAYSAAGMLEGQMFNALFAQSSSWGDEYVTGFSMRMSQRYYMLDRGVSALVSGDVARARLRIGSSDRDRPIIGAIGLNLRTGEDVDAETRRNREGMKDYQAYYNTTVAVGEFFVATLGVVLSPVTGGASLVLTAGVGVMGIGRAIDERNAYGAWTGRSIFHLGMGIAGTVLPFAGEFAAIGRAGTLATEGMEITGEAATAVAAARSVGASEQVIASIGAWENASLRAISGVSEATQLTFGQRMAQFVMGPAEASLFQRGVHIVGLGMMVGGGGEFTYDFFRRGGMWDMYQRGDMRGIEIFSGFVQAVAIPSIQAFHGMYRSSGTVGMEQGGIPEYVPRWRQVMRAAFLGDPILSAEAHQAARDVHIARIETSAMDAGSRQSYHDYLSRTGIDLAPADQIRFIREFNQAQADGRAVTFDQFAAQSPELTTIANETAVARVVRREISIRDLSASQFEYFRTRATGLGSEPARQRMEAYTAELARAPEPVRRAEDVFQSVRRGERTVESVQGADLLYIQQRLRGTAPTEAFNRSQQQATPPAPAAARVADMRTRRDRASADRAAADARTATGAQLNAQFTSVSESGAGRSYSLTTGNRTTTFTQQHVELAADLVHFAEQAVRNPESVPEIRARIRDGLMRQPNMDAATADRIAGERVAMVQQLAGNPEFRAATEVPGGANRRAQLRLGLEQAGRLPELINNPDVIRSSGSLEVQRILEQTGLTRGNLEELARGYERRAESQPPEIAAVLRENARVLREEIQRRATEEQRPPAPPAATTEGQMQGQPPGSRRPPTAADAEREVGSIPNPRIDPIMAGRPEAELRIARMLESMFPGQGNLTERQAREFATMYPEYRDAIAALNAARPEERPMVIRRMAQEIAYTRESAPFEAEISGRLQRGEITQQVADQARTMRRRMAGVEEVPASEFIPFADSIQRVQARTAELEHIGRNRAQAEADAFIAAARERAAAPREEATEADVEQRRARAPDDVADFVIRGVVESGRTVVAGSDYGQGVTGSNRLWFEQSGEVTRGIAQREADHAVDLIAQYVREGTTASRIPPGEGEFFQTNALLGNGNSDERGLIIVTRRPRDYRAAVEEVRGWVQRETAAGRPPDEAAIRAQIERTVESQGSHVDAFVVAIDKSGLGDIDRTTTWFIDPRNGQRVNIEMGRDVASVISREMFGDMMHRATEILRERAQANGGRLTAEDIDAAMRQVRGEVMGQRTVPERLRETVADARDILRAQDISERAAASREGRGFRPRTAEDERAAATEVLRRRLRREPQDAEVNELVGALRIPDPSTYRVQVGPDPAAAGRPRTMTLSQYATDYLGRGPELLAAFAHGTQGGIVRGRTFDFGAMYELAESRAASYTHPIAEALGITVEGPNAVSGVNEYGIARMQPSDTLAQGSVVAEIRFRLTDQGRSAVLDQIRGQIRAASGFDSMPRAEAVNGLMGEYSIARPEAERLYDSYRNGTLTMELFFDIVPRKGVLFARGEWGFSEGNTGLGHYGMNGLAQAVATAAHDFPGVRFVEDNLTVTFPPGTRPDVIESFYSRVREIISQQTVDHYQEIINRSADRSIPPAQRPTPAAVEQARRMIERTRRGELRIDIATTTRQIEAPTTVRDYRTRSTADSLGIQTQGVEGITYLVHSSHMSRRDLLYDAAFGDRGSAMMIRMDSLTGTDAAESRTARMQAAEGLRGPERDSFLLASALEEIRGTRSLRRPRDVMATFEDRAATARAREAEAFRSGDQVGMRRYRREAEYWDGMRRSVRDYVNAHGQEFITRYHERAAEGPGGGGVPGGPGGGRRLEGAEVVQIRAAPGARGATAQADLTAVPTAQLQLGEAAGRSELAARVLDPAHADHGAAVARFQALPPAERQTVQVEIATRLSLNEPAALADFARRIVRSRTGTPDPEALRIYETLGPQVRAQVDSLTTNLPFQRSATRQGEGMWWGRNRPDRARVEEAAERIDASLGRPRREAAEQPVVLEGTRGQPVQDVRQGPQVGGMAPEGPVAMSGTRRGPGSPVIQPPVPGVVEGQVVVQGGGRRSPPPRAVEEPQAPRTINDLETVADTWRARQAQIRERGWPETLLDFEMMQGVPAEIRGVVREMMQFPRGDERSTQAGRRFLQLQDERASAEPARQAIERRDQASADYEGTQVRSIMDSAAEGHRNPTLESIIRDMTRPGRLGTESPDQLRTALIDAFRRGEADPNSTGMTELVEELMRRHYTVEGTVQLLVLDRQMNSMLISDTMHPQIEAMARARGVDPAAFREALRRAYAQDGVLGVVNELMPIRSFEGMPLERRIRAENEQIGEFSGDQQWNVERRMLSMLSQSDRDAIFTRFGRVDSESTRPPPAQLAAFHQALFERLNPANRVEIEVQMGRMARDEFVRGNPEFVTALISGNLEGNIRSIPGFDGVSVSGVTRLGGNAGAYMIELSDGRRVFMKTEDVGPTLFGARLLEAQGLVGHVYRSSSGGPLESTMMMFSYDLPVSDTVTGRAFTQSYGISLDVHDYGSQHRTVHMRLPDGTVGDYRVASVAMLGPEIFRRPMPGERDVVAEIIANPQDQRYQAVRMFLDLAATPQGRQELYRAWSAYQEMSRRGLVVDRFDRNTAVFIVETPEGPRLTFQPIDTDFVAGRIRPGSDGRADLSAFNADYESASVGFVRGLQGALELRGTPLPVADLAREFLGSYRGAFLPDPPGVQSATRGVIQAHDGQLFGVTSRMAGGPGGTIEEAGRTRIIQNEHGQMRMPADEITAIADQVNSPESRAQYLDGLVRVFADQFGISGVRPFPEPPAMIRPPTAAPPEATSVRVGDVTIRQLAGEHLNQWESYTPANLREMARARREQSEAMRQPVDGMPQSERRARLQRSLELISEARTLETEAGRRESGQGPTPGQLSDATVVMRRPEEQQERPIPSAVLETTIGRTTGRAELEAVLPRGRDAATTDVRSVARVLDQLRTQDRSRVDPAYLQAYDNLRGNSDPGAVLREAQILVEGRAVDSIYQRSQGGGQLDHVDTMTAGLVQRAIDNGLPREAAVRAVAELRTDAVRLSDMAASTTRPQDPLDALAIDMARASARFRGAGSPTMADFAYGSMMRGIARDSEATFQIGQINGVITTRPSETAPASIDIEVTSRDQGLTYRLRVDENGVSMVDMGMTFLNGDARDAMLSYARRRMSVQMAAVSNRFAPVVELLRRGNIGEAARFAEQIHAGGSPALISYGRDQIVSRVGDPATDPAQLRVGYDSFVRSTPETQEYVISRLHEQTRTALAEAQTLEAAGRTAEATQRRTEANRFNRQAMFLTELQALNGRVGQQLEHTFGLPPGELSRIYLESNGRISEARMDLANRLGIDTTLYADDTIFGMITSGNIMSYLRELHPNASEFHIVPQGTGMVGAYRVTVIENGRAYTEFVKRVDLRPDAAGSDALVRSGVPAPHTIAVDHQGAQLTFRQADGSYSGYGISRNLAEFNGTIRIGGRDIQMSTRTATSIWDLPDSPALLDLYMRSPETFYSQLGFALAAQYAVGSIDGHELNSWAMTMRIENPTPENLAALGYRIVRDPGGLETLERVPGSAQPYTLWREADGSVSAFMIGRIDTDDSGGTYWASGHAGNFDLSSMRGRVGEQILTRMFARLTQIRNMQEALLAQAQARDPVFVSVYDTIRQAFGSSGNGPIYQGIQSWARTVGADPQYQAAMRQGFISHNGQPSGVSFVLNPNDHAPLIAQLDAEGMTYYRWPTNGEPAMPVFSRDGRSIMMADYESLSTYGWSPQVLTSFPNGREVYVVRMPHSEAGGTTGGLLNMGPTQFVVFSDRSQIPAAYRGREVPAVRYADTLFATPGLAAATGMPAERRGPIHVFNQIMGMGPSGLGTEFIDIQRRLIQTEWQTEQAARAPGADPRLLAEYAAYRLAPGYTADRLPTMRPP
ncbi:MAG: hypothetical protein U0R44_03430 [Candidatus Micrarchaeia archaeon]